MLHLGTEILAHQGGMTALRAGRARNFVTYHAGLAVKTLPRSLTPASAES
jgi:hypothetical protein